MADALKNNTEEVEEEVEEVQEEGEESLEETREERIARIKQEIQELRNAGLTDAEIREIAGDIEQAGSETEGKQEAQQAAKEIASDLEKQHDVDLSDATVDRLAKRIIELQNESKPTTTRRRVAPKVDETPKRLHFTERRLFGG